MHELSRFRRALMPRAKDTPQSNRFARALLLTLSVAASHAQAAPDEIQVYDDELNDPGKFGVELHSNYVLAGGRTPAHAGAMTTHHVLQLTPEFSYGIDRSWEAGLYFPPVAITPGGKTYVNGLRPRLKYIAPKDDGNGFFWGVNTEIGYFSKRVSDVRWGGEIRPILGYRSGNLTGIVNPILDIPLSGKGGHTPEFEPALKLAYQASETLAFGIEHYSGFGPVNRMRSWGDAEHFTFAVMDWKLGEYDVNLGIGHGNRQAEDRTVIKMIVALPL